MIMGSIFQEDTAVINVSMPNNKAGKDGSRKLRTTWRNRWIAIVEALAHAC